METQEMQDVQAPQAPTGVPVDAPDGLRRVAEAALPPAEGQPEHPGPVAVAKDLTHGDEIDALDYLLRPAQAHRYRVVFNYATEDGDVEMVAVVKQMPGKRLDSIERRNIDERTGQMDELRTAAEICAEAMVSLGGKGSSRSVDPASEEFRRAPDGTIVPSAADALAARFHFQSGILVAMASEIRRISGWSADRVGQAQRVVADAVGGS